LSKSSIKSFGRHFGKRAQVSTEYLIIIAISFAILVPGGFFFYKYSQSSNEANIRSQISQTGNNILTSAESIYGLADGSLVTLDLHYPKNVRDIYIIGNRELVIKYEVSGGINEAVFFSKVDLVGNYSYPARDPCSILPAGGCDNSSITYNLPTQGSHQLKFESNTKSVFISQIDDKGGPAITTIFVTSLTYKGNGIGGLAGADAKCQALAGAVGLSGTWKAWLSDCQGTNCASGTTASGRLTHSTGSYVLPNGVVVANNWADLTDGTLNNPINIDENKHNVGVSLVATGTLSNGDNFHNSTSYDGNGADDKGRYCNNWVGAGWSHVGYTNQTDYHWSSQISASQGSCGASGCGGGYCTVANLKLYCLRQ